MFNLDRIPVPLDLFPIVKAYIERQPVKCHGFLYKIAQKELKDKGLTIEAINNKPYHDRMMVESDLHELIDYCMEDYYESRKDIPND